MIVQWFAVSWGLSELVLALVKRAGGSNDRDRGSLFVLWGAITLAMVLGFGLRPLARIALPHSTYEIAGLAILVAGVLLRATAILTLRRSFTVNVAVSEGQTVIQHGVYRWMRHPSYTGAFLAILGIGLALGSWASVIAMQLAFLPALAYRIAVEERALTDAFGPAYREYASRTKRLIPGLI